MRIIKHLIFIYSIALLCFSLLCFSCAPSPENCSYPPESGNFIAIGFLQGIFLPFAALGKIMGLNIGLYDAGKDVFSYWLGYVFALLFYARIIHFVWVQIRLTREVK
jgi:hypothetical protein